MNRTLRLAEIGDIHLRVRALTRERQERIRQLTEEDHALCFRAEDADKQLIPVPAERWCEECQEIDRLRRKIATVRKRRSYHCLAIERRELPGVDRTEPD